MQPSNAFEDDRSIGMAWFNKSSDLRAAAAALWVSRDGDPAALVVQRCDLGQGFHMGVAVQHVFWMLAGMSLELIYKATLVATSQSVPSTHDLERLTSLASVATSEADLPRLRILTGAIVWDGRYPVPWKVAHYEGQRRLQREQLFDEVSRSGDLVVYTPNEVLGWADFDRLWRTGADRFWGQYTPG